MATPTHTPAGRGYDSALSYFHHANSYWVQQTGDLTCGVGVDLYDTHMPAWGLNSTREHVDKRNISAYEEAIFHRRMQAELESHDPDTPLFLFYAAHLVHEPYEVRELYVCNNIIVLDVYLILWHTSTPRKRHNTWMRESTGRN